MGWGTIYTYHGYLNRVLKHEIDNKHDEEQSRIDQIWREMLAYAAATPPAQTATNDSEEEPEPYPEFLARKFKVFRRELEESYQWLHHIADCREAMSENPEDVEDE